MCINMLVEFGMCCCWRQIIKEHWTKSRVGGELTFTWNTLNARHYNKTEPNICARILSHFPILQEEEPSLLLPALQSWWIASKVGLEHPRITTAAGKRAHKSTLTAILLFPAVIRCVDTICLPHIDSLILVQVVHVYFLVYQKHHYKYT